MEAHSGATVEQSNKKRKIAEDPLPTTHSDGPPLYDSWEDTVIYNGFERKESVSNFYFFLSLIGE